MDFAEKMQRCHEYVEALEEEKRKIQVFQRELPLCLELVTQAIEACRRELCGTTTEYMHGQSECSEQTLSEGTRPVLEEFIPIKRTHSSSDNDDDENDNDDQEQHSHKRNKTVVNNSGNSGSSNNKDKNSSDHRKKSDWLRSVQLWNQSPDPSPEEDVPRKAVVTELKRNGGAFQPFQKEKTTGKSIQTIAKTPPSVPASATSSTADTGTGAGIGVGSERKEEKNGQNERKQRRCWSPELHRRFLHALQQLGGSHAATPKQIREIMKVDGLTNDEVKSHLQKYRLHTRRPSPAIHNNSNPQAAPQFVVVGGIWVPPPEYAAVATTTASGETSTLAAAAANGIYAPVAAPPPTSHQMLQKQEHTQSEQMQSEERGSHSEDGVRSNSPATSSSTHTTTNSPLF